jgi:hypothetical protein
MLDEIEPVVAPSTTGGEQEPPAAAPAATTAPEPSPQEPSEAQAEPTPPTWLEELEKADSRELRKHPKIAGIIGSELQRAIQAERERIKIDEGEKAARDAEQKLRELAQSDPVTFADRWLSDAQKADVQRQLDDLHRKTRSDLATRIGAAFREIPEWKELTPEDMESLAKEVMGKSDDEALPVFSRAATKAVAKRMADKIVAEFKEKELAKEREAIRQEEAAKLLKNSDAPDGKPPKGTPSGLNINAMSDAEFDAYWKKKYGR